MVITLLLIVLTILVSLSDIKYRKIGNRLCFMVFVFSMNIPDVQSIISMSKIYILVLSLVLFYLGYWGGGDTKLLVAYLPAIHQDYLLSTLVIITIVGGGISSIYVLVNLIKHGKINSQITVPYGVAISIGCSIGILASL
ncbi:prepilin peptidase [Vibrio astriarenae]